jgi:hypothetical protein
MNYYLLDFESCKISLDEKINLRHTVINERYYKRKVYDNQDWLTLDQVLFNRLIGETKYINFY